MTRQQRSERETVALKILEVRELSLKCTQNGNDIFFLPISQIEYDEESLEEGKVSDITCPVWLLDDKGVIYK